MDREAALAKMHAMFEGGVYEAVKPIANHVKDCKFCREIFAFAEAFATSHYEDSLK